MNALLTIELLSYWHAGTGLGKGAISDAIVLKDDKGLPWLPGKTLKGLFREGFQILADANQLSNDTVIAYMGEASSVKQNHENNRPGMLCFSNANPSFELQQKLNLDENKSLKTCLYQTIASTKLNENGIAVDKSLRTIEVCLPITLQATITAEISAEFSEKEILNDLQKAAGLIRCLGSHRHRGLGKCNIIVSTGKGDTN